MDWRVAYGGSGGMIKYVGQLHVPAGRDPERIHLSFRTLALDADANDEYVAPSHYIESGIIITADAITITERTSDLPLCSVPLRDISIVAQVHLPSLRSSSAPSSLPYPI